MCQPNIAWVLWKCVDPCLILLWTSIEIPTVTATQLMVNITPWIKLIFCLGMYNVGKFSLEKDIIATAISGTYWKITCLYS